MMIDCAHDIFMHSLRGLLVLRPNYIACKMILYICCRYWTKEYYEMRSLLLYIGRQERKGA